MSRGVYSACVFIVSGRYITAVSETRAEMRAHCKQIEKQGGVLIMWVTFWHAGCKNGEKCHSHDLG